MAGVEEGSQFRGGLNSQQENFVCWKIKLYEELLNEGASAP